MNRKDWPLMSGPSLRVQYASTPSSLCLAAVGPTDVSATDLALLLPDKTSLSSNSFRRRNQLVGMLAPGDMGSLYVELLLNMTTVARPPLARALIEEFNSVSGSSSNGRIRASDPHRMWFMFAELVGRFRNCKL